MYHKAVLYDEVIENIIVDKDAIYLDCTLGGGGHSMGILENSTKNSKLIAIDQDQNAIDYVNSNINGYEDKIKIFRNNLSSRL